MPIVKHSVVVRGPIDDVFDLSQSDDLRPEWDPSVRSQPGLRNVTQGVTERVTQRVTVRRPTLVDMQMVDGPAIVSDFSASWHFAERDDGRVDVAVRYDFTCRPTWLAPVMDRIGVWYLRRDIEHRLEAFRRACDDTDLLDHVRTSRPPEPAAEPEPELVDVEPIPPIVDAAYVRTVLEAGHRSGEIVLCDVRSTMTGHDPRADYLARHLPGAVFVPLEGVLAAPGAGTAGRHPLPTPDDFASSLGALGIGNDATVIAYDDRGGAFAARLVWMLRILGQRAALLDGGLDAWSGPFADGTVERPAVGRIAVGWPPAATADADEVVTALVAGRVVIDSRDAARYAGQVEPIDAVAGHVPGAINLPFTHNLGPDGRFRPAAELTDRFRSVAADGDAIVYCGSGVTACHNALALEHAGLGLPTVYVGSWSGWSSDPHRPVATSAPSGDA